MRRIALCAFVALLTATTSVAAASGSCGKKYEAVAQLQVLSLQLSRAAERTAAGDPDALKSLNVLHGRGGELLKLLAAGSPSRDLPRVEQAWAQLGSDVAAMLENGGKIAAGKEIVSDVGQKLPPLNARLEEVLMILKDTGGSADQLVAVSRLMLVSDRMLRRMQSIVAGGDDAMPAASGLQRDTNYYSKSLQALINGDAEQKLKKISNKNARDVLGDASSSWSEIAPSLARLIELAPALEAARQAADKAQLDSEDMMARTGDLMARLAE